MHRRLLLDELIQDLRIGLRGLLRARLLTLTIVATVGLGIGATTVIFGAVNATLLRPLPYADPERLVRIYTDAPPNKFPFSVADYQALEAQQTRFERIAGYQSRALAFSDGKVAERLTGRIVSWTYFGLLGITPALGRDFTEADGRPGSPRTVIVSQTFWRQRLGGRADAIGKPVTLDGVDYTLTGVLPPTNGPLERGQQFFIAAQWPTPTRKGPFFITVSGPPAARVDRCRGSRRRIGRAARDQQAAVRRLEELVSGLAGDVEHDRPEDIRRGRPADGRSAGARGGRVRVADRLHERLEPAHRARQQPPPGTGGADRARRLARTHRPLPARRERAAGDRCRGRRTSRSHGRASACCASWPPTTSRARRRSRSTARPAAVLLVLTLTSGAALRPGAGTARHGRPGRRRAARVGAIVHRHRLGPAPAPHPGRVAVRDHDATAHRRRAAAGEPAPARARRSRLRHAQPDYRLDHRPRLDVPRAGTRRRVLG